MTELSQFLADVFASGRLQILQALESGPMRFTQVAKVLKASESEVSRNLNRLLSGQLVSKHPTKGFELTGSARIALAALPPLSFVAAHQDYVNTHAFGQLPPEFNRRLHQLAGARLVNDPFTIFGHLEHMFTTVEKRFDGQWIIGKGLGVEQLELHRLAKRRLAETGAKARTVMLRRELSTMLKQSPDFLEHFETRLLDAAPTSVAATEHSAIVWFEGDGGHLDFNYAFLGDDPAFLSWTQDLFEYYWDRADPAPRSPLRSGVLAARKTVR